MTLTDIQIQYTDSVLSKKDEKEYKTVYQLLKNEMSDPNATGRLARMYRDGKGVEQDINTAVELMAATVNKDRRWIIEYSDLVLDNNYEDKYEDILKLLSSLKNNERAYGRLARMYRDGKGVNCDLDLAVRLLSKAAQKDKKWLNEKVSPNKVVFSECFKEYRKIDDIQIPTSNDWYGLMGCSYLYSEVSNKELARRFLSLASQNDGFWLKYYLQTLRD